MLAMVRMVFYARLAPSLPHLNQRVPQASNSFSLSNDKHWSDGYPKTTSEQPHVFHTTPLEPSFFSSPVHSIIPLLHTITTFLLSLLTDPSALLDAFIFAFATLVLSSLAASQSLTQSSYKAIPLNISPKNNSTLLLPHSH